MIQDYNAKLNLFSVNKLILVTLQIKNKIKNKSISVSPLINSYNNSYKSKNKFIFGILFKN